MRQRPTQEVAKTCMFLSKVLQVLRKMVAKKNESLNHKLAQQYLLLNCFKMGLKPL